MAGDRDGLRDLMRRPVAELLLPVGKSAARG
jgi:hypothetical protein